MPNLAKIPLKVFALFVDHLRKLKGGKTYTEDDSKFAEVFEDVNLLHVLVNSQQALALVIVAYETLPFCIPSIIKELPTFEDRWWVVANKCYLSPYIEGDNVKYEHVLLMLVNQDPRGTYEGDERLKWLKPTRVVIDPLPDTPQSPGISD